MAIYTYDFIGGDIASTNAAYSGAFYNNNTATWSENGVAFSMSHTGLGQVNAGHAGTYNAGLEFSQINSLGFGSAVLDLVGPASQNSFSNLTLNFTFAGGNEQFKVSLLSGTASNVVASQTFTGNQAPGAFGAYAASMMYTGTFNKIKFTYLTDATFTPDLIVIGSMITNINCFVTGTKIATPTGQIAIETLRAGDEILTSEGNSAIVRWLGEQKVDTKFANPAKVNPVLIKENALADGVPARDLMVSSDHAIAIDGVLYNAGTLINGRTITRVAKMPVGGFSYFHIETDAHELLLAENTPAETFIDYAGRDSFINGDEADNAASITEMPMPRVSSARLVPTELKDKLESRAAILTGYRFAAE